MSNVKQNLEQAKKKDDAALLWRAVAEATAEEIRSFRPAFSDTFRRLDRTQQEMFSGLVALHGHRLAAESRRVAAEISRR